MTDVNNSTAETTLTIFYVHSERLFCVHSAENIFSREILKSLSSKALRSGWETLGNGRDLPSSLKFSESVKLLPHSTVACKRI